MNNRNKIQVRCLTQWISVATHGLLESTQERIRLEIEAHYVDAVESQIGRGLNEVDAEKAALAELGDANTASRRFRIRHLTEKDVKYLISRWRATSRLSHPLVSCAIFGLWFCFFPKPDWFGITLFMLAMSQATGVYLIRRKFLKFSQRAFASMAALESMIYVFIFAKVCLRHFDCFFAMCIAVLRGGPQKLDQRLR